MHGGLGGERRRPRVCILSVHDSSDRPTQHVDDSGDGLCEYIACAALRLHRSYTTSGLYLL